MLDKRMTAADIVGQLYDGMTIGIGGWGPRRKPMALVREIAASPVRDLTQLRGHRDCMIGARTAYQAQVELALNNANARRVAVLADKIALLARF